MLAPFTKPTGHNILFLTVSLLFHHNTLTNKLDWRYFSLVCLSFPPFIHPPLPPPSSPPPTPLTPTVPGAMLCLLKRCVVSECSACHQYGWVTEVAGSNAVHCFTPTLAVPLPEQITHAGVSERVNVCVCVCDGMGYVVCVLCPRIDMCVCVSSYCMYVFGLRVYSLSHSAEGFDLWPGPSASWHNEHVVSEACGTPALIPTRTASGESVPDQLYHCVDLSHWGENVTQHSIW